MTRPAEVIYSKPMSEPERALFIVSDDLPALKVAIKKQADKEGVSSTVLMIRSLCEFFDLDEPSRAARPAREAQASTALSLSVPNELWQAVHAEVGRRGTSKKEVIVSIFTAAFTKKKAGRK